MQTIQLAQQKQNNHASVEAWMQPPLCRSRQSEIRVLTLLTLTETSHKAPSSLEENRQQTSSKANWETLQAKKGRYEILWLKFAQIYMRVSFSWWCCFWIACCQSETYSKWKKKSLTSINVQFHLANQNVNPARDSLQHRIRNPLHNDVAVPWYVVLPGWKRKDKITSALRLNHAKFVLIHFLLETLTCGFHQQTSLYDSSSKTSFWDK